MTAFYNEHDPKAAAWLRELIKAGHIADGIVDERSIEDIRPDELTSYTQCHFFAGIGVWSYALRQAGVSDDTEVWTGSCPCQSFSAAGAGKGFADERHLWPAWFHLIEQCRPRTIFGEQVEAAIRFGWLDLVQSDLEGIGYACGAVPFPACSVGAPHIRQRLYFVADADDARSQGWRVLPERAAQFTAGAGSVVGELADTDGGHACAEREQPSGQQRQQPQDGGAGVMAEPHGTRLQSRDGHLPRVGHRHPPAAEGSYDRSSTPGPVNGFWRTADWIFCTDLRWRAVEPGAQPLAHGAPSRVGRLRGYGNAIVAEQAKAFIKSYLEATAATDDIFA
jgi:DNA (cytosine-5)-methyltransferase 1